MEFMEYFVVGISTAKETRNSKSTVSGRNSEDKKSSRLDFCENLDDSSRLENRVESNPPINNQLPMHKPPVQIHIHQCPDCAKATTQTSKGELQLSETELEQALCDCQISQPGQRNTTSIPPATRRKVLASARHKCQCPGCDHTQFLEVHHIVPRSKGGSNHLDNLLCICSSCHKLLHDGKLLSSGLLVKESQATYRYQVGFRMGKNQQLA